MLFTYNKKSLMLIWRSQRITSSSAHYVTPLQKYFSHPSFSYLLFFFATPLPCPLHVKLRLQIAGCSKKKPSGPRSYSETPLRKQGGSVRSNLLHSFVAGGQQLCRTFFCQPQQTVHIWSAGPKTILLNQTAMFWLFFFFIKFF